MRRALLFFLIVIAVVVPFASVRAQTGAVASPVVFRPKTGTTLTLEGNGPYRGALEMRRVGSGLTVVNELALDDYVKGVREVPGTWPMEALKAQAVAARTYVLWEIEKGYWKRFGYDVCGTTSCQVYQGATAELGERGRRWAKAVEDTKGQVLLYRGHPALTRYFSSSGGRTLNNEVVFPTDGPRPYLRAVDDPYDKVSPLHRWTQAFTRTNLQAILHRAIRLNGTITDVSVSGRDMVIKTKNGQVKMTTVRFRRVMSNTAPSVVPDVYPGTRSDGEAMPFTLPSSRFTVEKTSTGFVVHGMGYGHGVGMSQYGALGRAKAGQSYRDILAAYYGDLSPQPWNGQNTIRVAILRGVESVNVSANGVFGISGGGRTVEQSTLGAWAVSRYGTSSLELSPPQGHSLPLMLTGVRTPKDLLVDPPKEGRTLDVDFVVPKPARVTATVSLDGKTVATKKIVVEAGERTLSISLDPKRLAGRATYRVKLEAFDGSTTVTDTADVVLVLPAHAFWRFVAIVLLGLGFTFWWRRRRVAQERAKRRDARAGTPTPQR